MKQLLKILVVHSLKDLVKFKSFLLLVLGLYLLDKLLRNWLKVDKSSLGLPSMKEISLNQAPFLFDEFPWMLLDWVLDIRTLGVLTALFFLKQLISMWPSSDMRRMHRKERERFGLLSSLFSLKWHQMLWDAIAVSTIVGIVGGWCLLQFGLTRTGWHLTQNPYWLIAFGGLAGLGFPLGMAGFSYSSKLAVISRGGFQEKLTLFFKLFLSWDVLWKSWVFYTVRVVLEGAFVVALPLIILIHVEDLWLKLSLAALSATPVYSYVKMASFKFFLEVYRNYDLVYEEYKNYYQTYLL